MLLFHEELDLYMCYNLRYPYLDLKFVSWYLFTIFKIIPTLQNVMASSGIELVFVNLFLIEMQLFNQMVCCHGNKWEILCDINILKQFGGYLVFTLNTWHILISSLNTPWLSVTIRKSCNLKRKCHKILNDLGYL